jgi:hypothetical protein
MSDNKKFTPKEAAMLVLAKAQELYKNSNLAKGDWAKIHSKLERQGYSKESADKIDGAIKAKMNKSDESGNNPDAKADAQLGEKVEQDVQQHEAANDAPEHKMKGVHKLLKFEGRMELKKSQKAKEMDKAETGHEKGVHTVSRSVGWSKQPLGSEGMSEAGRNVRLGGSGNKIGAQDEHNKVKAQMQAMPKPKLPG